MQGFNYLYDDFGAKISVNFIGPFAKPTNSIVSDSIYIDLQVGDSTRETRRFDIKRTGADQTELDIVSFGIELNGNETTHTQQLNVSLKITTDAHDGVAFQMFIDLHALDAAMGAICGGIILILLNILIISEVHQIHYHSNAKLTLLMFVSSGDSSYIGCIVGSIRFNWHIGCISRQANHERYHQMDRL